MTLMTPKWRLSHARGYLSLGMIDQAEAELDELPPEQAGETEALALRAAILQSREHWLLLEPIGRQLVANKPDEPGFWIIWAYAARRAQSLHAAEAILRDAEIQHPEEATIQFNLGCYACQRGDLTEARRRVEQAIRLNEAFLESARSDPDLQALRELGFPPPAQS